MTGREGLVEAQVQLLVQGARDLAAVLHVASEVLQLPVPGLQTSGAGNRLQRYRDETDRVRTGYLVLVEKGTDRTRTRVQYQILYTPFK